MLKLINKIFGDKHAKDIKKIQPIVDEINSKYYEFEKLTDEELKAKTPEFKEKILNKTKEFEDKKKALQEKLVNEVLTTEETQDITAEIKKIDEQIFENTEEVLDEILPEAFAAVKQVCKRLKEREHTYEYAGQKYIWDMVPYDVQLVGGIVIHEGKISEMATGEGKTLVAIAPVYLNALSGKGVHLVTVNDYLAKRDSDWMRPVYEFLGVSVEALQSKMDHDQRKKVYASDIIYGTNNEFGFDYLRDNMVVDAEQMVQRGHWFTIIDEVDSVLIDEARTPLIISGPVPQTDQQFEEMNPRVKRLVDAQSRFITKIVSEAEELLKKGDKESREKAGVNLLRAYRGLPKHKKLSKLLQDPDLQKLKHETEMFYLRDQGRKMHEIDDELYYSVEEKNHQIDVSEKGRELLVSQNEDPDMFVIPDIASEFSQLEVDTNLTPDEIQRRKDELHLLFSERSDRIHTISQLLKAYTLYENDKEYVVKDNKVMIVDEFTGRILEGRRYSDGLHQAIEAKEHVKVERDTQTMATITLQNYFRLYNKIAGMTGTAETEQAEFEKIYDLEVTVIPTNRPIVRDDMEDLIYKTKKEKYNAIGEKVQELVNQKRAVLVGTASVDVSEVLSKILKRQGIKHNVLNAKHHEREAEIVALAGKKGAVTIATNMAGRGTDIKLDPVVKENGGLAILGSERHDARRIDRQLRGRAGRQGDPGSSQFYISLEDDLMRLFSGDKISGVMSTLKIPEGEPITHSMISKSVERAQKKVEENNFGVRKRLLEYDDVMNQQREVIYTRRKSALRGDRLRGELFDYLEDIASDYYEEFKSELDVTSFKNQIRANFLCEFNLTKEEYDSSNKNEVISRIVDAAKEFYLRKEDLLGSEYMARVERVAVLQTIDDKWKDHLRAMDDLKEGIGLRSYGQKDPLLEYKTEAFGMFVDLIKEINKDSVSYAFKFFPTVVDSKGRRIQLNAETVNRVPQLKNTNVTQGMNYEHSNTTPAFFNANAVQAKQTEHDHSVDMSRFKSEKKKFGRNDLVKVRFADGATKKVKYKKVEKDIQEGKLEILED
jgi:preprotein translocase subunit SecA